MADSSEPKKETVRITVSPQPPATSAPASESRDTVRIHLPTRPPTNPPTAPTDSSPLPAVALAKEGSARAAAAALPASLPLPAAPKKETARITVLPDPPTKPSVEMKKTQPLIDLPAVEKPMAPVTITPESPPELNIHGIPMPLCWALLAGSVAILILQIWNYFS